MILFPSRATSSRVLEIIRDYSMRPESPKGFLSKTTFVYVDKESTGKLPLGGELPIGTFGVLWIKPSNLFFHGWVGFYSDQKLCKSPFKDFYDYLIDNGLRLSEDTWIMTLDEVDKPVKVGYCLVPSSSKSKFAEQLVDDSLEDLLEQRVQKALVTNQGITAKKSLTWNRLRFRSEAEREVAKVLDEMGIMFFPNASGRVMSEDGMTTREVDFHICWRGKWGILECDNEIMHLVNSLKTGKLPSAARDHKRDNDFNRHGQWFIKRFTEEECKKTPRKVVQQFLDMLHKFHEDQRYLIMGDSTQEAASIKTELESLNNAEMRS